MHQTEENYFNFTYPQIKKSSLINRRQQNSTLPIQSLELPPLSKLLPTAAPKPHPFVYPTQSISTLMLDPTTAAAVMAANQYYPIMDQFIPEPVSEPRPSGEKTYSFVTIPGINQKKRPRRRYDEIERLYHCNWPGCSKSYGTLNHLNAHVSMQNHGPKRQPSEFREMRKEWRRQKKERDSQRKRQENYYL